MSEQIDESRIQIEQKDKKKPKLIKLLQEKEGYTIIVKKYKNEDTGEIIEK